MTRPPRNLVRKRSLQEQARQIFGEDPDAIGRWVEYWQHSRERNRALLATFEKIALVRFEEKRILDIGCGTGGLGEIIGDRSRLYVGADYNLHVLQFAQPESRRSYLQCSGVRLPFREGLFDYIFAFDVIEHVQNGLADQQGFLKEVARVLKPSGFVFFTTPNFWYPFDGHTRLYGPQFLPTRLADTYIRHLNPGFIKEHTTFDEIKLLTPSELKTCLQHAGLVFLHDLPCSLDKPEFARHNPGRGLLAYLGLGWYPHAEFWGILVHRESADFLRRKLRKEWFYEQNQPSSDLHDFGPVIDFGRDAFGYQLGDGWYWHETEPRGFRWTSGEVTCFLESPTGAPCLRVCGFTPVANHLTVWAAGTPGGWFKIGEHFCKADEEFDLLYLAPFDTAGGLVEIRITCDRTHRSEVAADRRELGVMIFSLALTDPD